MPLARLLPFQMTRTPYPEECNTQIASIMISWYEESGGRRLWA